MIISKVVPNRVQYICFKIISIREEYLKPYIYANKCYYWEIKSKIFKKWSQWNVENILSNIIKYL